MSRPALIRCDAHPYHVVSRCQNQNFFPLHLDEVWQVMIQQLSMATRLHNLAVHAFVLMGNHFHLLCRTPKSNLDLVMNTVLRNSSTIILKKAKTEGPLWGGRYRWSLIENKAHYYQVYRYIYQNPVRAGIVRKVEDWPYSTIKGQAPFPLHSNTAMFFGGEEGERIWLNEIFNKEEQNLIKKGLRHGHFDLNHRKSELLSRRGLLPHIYEVLPGT
jgi:putative transposase